MAGFFETPVLLVLTVSRRAKMQAGGLAYGLNGSINGI